MLERIKKFYEEKKFEIVVVGGLVLLVAGTALLTRKVILSKEALLDPAISHIWFKDVGKRLSLDEVKKVFEHADALNDSYAIVHIPGELDKFIAVNFN
jgi:hypothetical protein